MFSAFQTIRTNISSMGQLSGRSATRRTPRIRRRIFVATLSMSRPVSKSGGKSVGSRGQMLQFSVVARFDYKLNSNKTSPFLPSINYCSRSEVSKGVFNAARTLVEGMRAGWRPSWAELRTSASSGRPDARWELISCCCSKSIAMLGRLPGVHAGWRRSCTRLTTSTFSSRSGARRELIGCCCSSDALMLTWP